MTRYSLVARLLRASIVSVLVLASVAGIGTMSASAVNWEPINGVGSTWSENAIKQWVKNVAANYGMTIGYSGEGSSAGRTAFIQGTTDFAVSEIPFQTKPENGSAPEVPPRGYAYMPIVAGGTSFMYNLKIGGKRVSNLRLSGATVSKIFTGIITNWNDPAIKADNPGLAMPDKAIVPVVRSDGSGSSAQFTLWMSKQFPDIWNAYCAKVGRPTPCGLTSQYPTYGNVSKSQSGSLGVSGYVSQDYGDGAITYVEYSYPLKAGFPVAKVLNTAGYFVEPTAPAVAVALMQAKINPDLTQILDGVYDNADARTYPLSSYSYMILPTEVGGIFTVKKGATLGAFANYFLCEGQQQAAALGYSPLPMNLVLAGFDQIKRIPGADASKVDINSCNNPTFKAGDSPSNNQLALSAAQPPACDRAGPTQCATGTAGATAATTVSGGTATSSASGAPAGANEAGASSGGSAGTGASLDEAGNPILGTGVAGSAVASSFTVADDGWGLQQSVMLVSGLLLIGAVVLPPFLWRRWGRARARGLVR